MKGKQRKRRFLVAAGVALAVLMAACGGEDDSEPAGAAGEEFLIGYAGAIQSNPNNKAVEDGIKVQAEALGMEVVVTDANLDPNKQISDVDSLIQQGVDALLIWPIDPKGIQPSLDRARDQGIPIFVQDTPEGGPYASNFQVNNFDAAKEAASSVGDEIAAGASVAIIEGIPQVPVLRARNEGFLEGAEASGLDVVARQVNPKDSADGARPIVDAWMVKFGAELEAILAYNDPSALGAASAVGGGFQPMIIGMNGSTEGVDAVRRGAIAATWDMRTVEIGNGMAWAAFQVLTEEGEIPETINVEMERVDETNVDQWVSIEDRLSDALNVDIEMRGGEAFLVTSE